MDPSPLEGRRLRLVRPWCNLITPRAAPYADIVLSRTFGAEFAFYRSGLVRMPVLERLLILDRNAFVPFCFRTVDLVSNPP
jgi:hypothetical protein